MTARYHGEKEFILQTAFPGEGKAMSLKLRLVSAFGASVLGPLVTIFIQFINVPVMLRYWGANLYGEWLVISTIPAYLLLTDLGFGNVAGSDMTMRSHAGDREGAIETFQSVALLVLCISFLIGLILSVIIFFLPMHRILHLSAMSPKETQLTLVFLCVNCLVILQWSVIMAAYRCDGNYARGMLYINCIRILEGVSFLCLLVTHSGPVQLSILMLAISLIGTSLLLIEKRRLIPWLPLGVRHASWDRVRVLMRPAIAFMAFPTSSAISLQGTTLLVGMVLGPVAVAVFNPMRTLSRTVYQLTDAVKNSVWPELSAAYGQQNWALARKLHRTACQVALWLAVVASLVLALIGPTIFRIWTHGRITMDVPTFYMLLVVVLVNSTWNASSAVPMAANRHQRLAVFYLICAVISLVAGYLLTQRFHLFGTATALLLCDLGMSLYVVQMSNRLLSDQWPAFAASMLDMTQLNTIRARLTRRLM